MVRKKTPETMKVMKKEILEFLDVFKNDPEGRVYITPRTIAWLKTATEQKDSSEFFRFIEKIGYEKGFLDARYGLQLYLKEEE